VIFIYEYWHKCVVVSKVKVEPATLPPPLPSLLVPLLQITTATKQQGKHRMSQ